MLFPLEQRGRPVRTFRGSGRLINCRPELTGSFEAIQYADSRILIAFKSDYIMHMDGDPVHSANMPNHRFYAAQLGPVLNDNARLIGTTEAGAQIEVAVEARGEMTATLPFIKEGEEPTERATATYLLSGERLTCHYPSDEAPKAMWFHLTNMRLPNSSQTSVTFRLGEDLVTVHSSRGYDRAEILMREIRSIEQTAQVRIALQEVDVASDSERLSEVVADLCLLLSLAQGNPITWINYDIVSEAGEKMSTVCVDTTTRSPSNLYLISHDDTVQLIAFVERAYTKLATADQAWNIKAIIPEYVETKFEKSRGEARGLRLAVCMEMLKQPFLEQKQMEHIFREKIFTQHVSALKKEIGNVLENLLPNLTSAQKRIMKQNIRALNTYPFKVVLARMCTSVGFSQATHDERERFVNIRNDLVHRGRFSNSTWSPWKQYLFLDAFVGRFLVSALEFPTSSMHPLSQKLFDQAN